MEDLTGRTAVVTGGGSGIGRASALALARAGVAVVVADINGDRAVAAAAEIVAEGGRATGRRSDVSSDEDVAALRDVALGEFGRVDIVMNNVGVLVMGLPQNIPMEAWRRAVDVNLLSAARSISVFLPGLLAQGSGHIVNTASTAGLFAYSYERLPYSATKGAIVALSEALALYARPLGVGVTLLCPGPVATNIGEQVQVFGEMGPIHGPPLPTLDPAVVGDLVVDAIRRDVFFLPTHPEVNDILVERARDPEGFVDRQIAILSE
ncbi:MAG TPA: SDR family oxidoreductase [Acidimicrobiales bacterium]|nr:SDR family oxidoreductase [Acidimicrobiales bacterium]